tara:strand:+ start:52 stop:714 length:663 start_codon:yes stop_codon:yes gene_type:complete
MTVIRPNSISGVSSITGNGGDISIFRADGTAADVTVNNITSGVITATTFSGNLSDGTINATTGTFSGNLGVGGVLTYEDVTNVDAVGILTARSGIRVGTGGTVGPVGSGIVTYFGDGSQLTGIDAGTLKHNNNTKAQATANGVTITGGLIPAANNTHDLGASGVAWRNLYVNDAHFSNEGHSNSVDGTWGSWTLQEGENDIFMINNRTGKKYSITMKEVE